MVVELQLDRSWFQVWTQLDTGGSHGSPMSLPSSRGFCRCGCIKGSPKVFQSSVPDPEGLPHPCEHPCPPACPALAV